jgi:hypothetical protein
LKMKRQSTIKITNGEDEKIKCDQNDQWRKWKEKVQSKSSM